MRTKRKGLLLTVGLLAVLSTFTFGTVLTASASTAEMCTHEYSGKTYVSTCTAQGYTEYTCSLCGDVYKDNFVNPHGHTYTEVIVPATCTEQGFTTHYCKDCGYHYSDNYVEPKGHNYTDTVFNPTCTDYGYTMHTCLNCKSSYKDNIVERLGHDYSEEIVEATCLEGGYTTFTCNRCGESHIGNETEAKGHNYAEVKTGVTCTSYGYSEYVCLDCDDRYVGNYIKPNGHSYVDTVVPATDEQLGYTKHTCKYCSYTYLSDFSESKDDGYIETPEIEQPPTHEHSYTAEVNVNRTNKEIILNVVCDCGQRGENISLVVFTNSNGEATTMQPINGVVNYSIIPNGEYDVTVLDDKSNIMKVFILTESGNVVEPDIPNEPSVPQEPNNGEHEHRHALYSAFNEETKSFTALCVCDCGDKKTGLTVSITNSNGQAKTYTPNEVGEIYYGELTNGEYTLKVLDSSGIGLTELNLTITDNEEIVHEQPTETTQPEIGVDDGVTIQPDDEFEDNEQVVEETEDGSSLGLILGIVIFLLVVAGGVVTVIILKKKNKNKKGDK